MQTNRLLKPIHAVAILVFLSGCTGVPRSFKETTLDDMRPILTEVKYDSLQSLSDDEQIRQFVSAFWQENDTSGGELKAEYLRRLEYANAHFPDRRGWGRSDRKRIYLQYGPPVFVERQENTNISLGTFTVLKAVEVWVYMTPASGTTSASYGGDDMFYGQTRFVFGDVTGSGFYTILYSSEDCADIDTRMFVQH
jgi:GWxTD domain-containing protein